MNKILARQLYNVFIKKDGMKYSVVRHAAGFDKPGKVLVKGITNEAEAFTAVKKAVANIHKHAADFGVFISLKDSTTGNDVANFVELSGLKADGSDVFVQDDGQVYFIARGDNGDAVQSNVQSALSEASIDFANVTLTDADIIKQMQAAQKPEQPKEAAALPFKPNADPKPNTAYKETSPGRTDNIIGTPHKPVVALPHRPVAAMPHSPNPYTAAARPETPQEFMPDLTASGGVDLFAAPAPVDVTAFKPVMITEASTPEQKRYNQLLKQGAAGLLKDTSELCVLAEMLGQLPAPAQEPVAVIVPIQKEASAENIHPISAHIVGLSKQGTTFATDLNLLVHLTEQGFDAKVASQFIAERAEEIKAVIK